jgi:hypothetical protein
MEGECGGDNKEMRPLRACKVFEAPKPVLTYKVKCTEQFVNIRTGRKPVSPQGLRKELLSCCQPVTKMSTRNLLGKGEPLRKADKFAAVCEQIL